MKIIEFRGVEGLVAAEIIEDSEANYTVGEVKQLAGVAEISKSTDSNSEAHYYDNIPAIVITSTGPDTVTINASALELDTLAWLTGQFYEESTGMLVEQERVNKYFAIGYITKNTDGEELFVWRHKGTFNIPDEDHKTEDDSTDANGQELTYTGIMTTHKFTKTGQEAKATVVNTAKNPVSKSNFFNTVQTPDTVQPAVVTPSVTVYPSRETVEIGQKKTLQARTVPSTGGTVAWSSSSTSVASVNASTGEVTGVSSGNATITATLTYGGQTYTDTCAVTVPVASA